MNKKTISLISAMLIIFGIGYTVVKSLKGLDLEIFDFYEDDEEEE